MTDVKVETENKTDWQGSGQHQNDRSATVQTGGQLFPSLFSLNPRESSGSGRLERLWWIAAPQTAH
jgi:hypothetical protein